MVLLNKFVLIFAFLLLGISVPSLSRGSAASFDEAVDRLEAGEFELAQSLLSASVMDGDTRAAALLGYLLAEGTILDGEYEKGIRLLELAAEDGEPSALYWLGSTLLSVQEGQSDLPTLAKIENPRDVGLQYLHLAADAGHPDAMYLLGETYLATSDPGDSNEIARHWLEKAAANGRILASSRIAIIPALQGQRLTTEQIGKMVEIAPDGDAVLHTALASAYLNRAKDDHDTEQGLMWLNVAIMGTPQAALTPLAQLLAQYQLGAHAASNPMAELLAQNKPIDARILANARRDAEAWLLSAAGRGDSLLSSASAWCQRERPGSVECIGQSIVRHRMCQVPYFPGYFQDYYLSSAYDKCRRSLEAKD